MFVAFLAAMAEAAEPAPAEPTLGAVTVASLNDGACSGSTPTPAASLRVSWSAASPDATLYDTKVYKNGVLQATLPNTTTTHDETVTGYVLGGLRNSFASSWTYRVDVVRKSDSQVVSTQSSAPWQEEYGQCGHGGEA